MVMRDLTMGRSKTGEPWWKAVVLGTFVGGLLAIGGIYVWEDAKDYRQHRPQST